MDGNFINNLNGNFTIVSNKIINNKKLSLEAKGLYLFLATNQDLTLSSKELAKHLRVGEKKLIRYIEELKKYNRL